MGSDRSEARLVRRLARIASDNGWMVYRVARGRALTAGWPDLICVRGWRLVAFECKTAAGRVTADQRKWLRALDAIDGGEGYIVRPHPPSRPGAVKQPTIGVADAASLLRGGAATPGRTGEAPEPELFGAVPVPGPVPHRTVRSSP